MNHKLAGVCATLCFLKKVVDIPFTAWRMPDWRTRPAHLSGPSVCSLEVVNDNYCGYLNTLHPHFFASGLVRWFQRSVSAEEQGRRRKREAKQPSRDEGIIDSRTRHRIIN